MVGNIDGQRGRYRLSVVILTLNPDELLAKVLGLVTSDCERQWISAMTRLTDGSTSKVGLEDTLHTRKSGLLPF